MIRKAEEIPLSFSGIQYSGGLVETVWVDREGTTIGCLWRLIGTNTWELDRYLRDHLGIDPRGGDLDAMKRHCLDAIEEGE